jgi:carbon-monoxide dehydrogenase large subunit
MEDPALVTGRGRFVDDLPIVGCAHLAVLRSPLAHGRILGVDVGRTAVPGALLVWTAEDLPGLSWPQVLPDLPARLPLAAGKVCYVGEPIVAVLAESRHLAADASDEIQVDLEPLEPVVDPEEAMAEGAPLPYEELGSNVVYRSGTGPRPWLFDAADVVVRHSYVENRIAPPQTTRWNTVPMSR